MRLLHTLRLADENILAPLLVEPGFSRKALNQALWRHRKAGFLHRFPKRLPLAHSYSIVAPNVYILSAAGARDIGLAEKQVKEVEQLYDAIRYSDSHRLVERLDKSTIHAALLRGQEAGLFTLTRFKEEPWIEAVGKKARADVTYQLNGTYDVAVEIDSGEERLRSDDKSRRTIEKKVHKYGVLDHSRELPPFRVLFVHSPFIHDEPDRAAHLLELCKTDGHVTNHRADFFQVCSMRHFKAGLEDPYNLRKAVIHCAGFERPLSIAPPPATVGVAARQTSLVVGNDERTAHASGE